MSYNGSKLEQKIIDKYYGGDTTAYNDDMARRLSNTYCWDDIYAHAVVLPEYEHEAIRQIEYQLGFVPARQLTLPHELFIRSAIQRYDFDHRDFDRLCSECSYHIDIIKNLISERKV